jgi:hypothetical protein
VAAKEDTQTNREDLVLSLQNVGPLLQFRIRCSHVNVTISEHEPLIQLHYHEDEALERVDESLVWLHIVIV